MKKRDFLKSAAALAGVTAVSPLMAAMSPSKQVTDHRIYHQPGLMTNRNKRLF